MTTTEHGVGNHDEVGSDAVEQFARDHPALVKLGRVGWVAKGLVYALTGVLAVAIAIDPFEGSADGEASQSGAVAAIGERPAGALVLYVAAIGLVLYSLWRIVTIMLPAENDIATWLTRVGYMVSTIVYLALAWSAVTLASRPGGNNSEDSRVERVTRTAMEKTMGRELVGAVGIALVVIGAYFLWKAISASFRSELAPGGVGPLSTEHLVTLGRIGWAGRSVMMALVGFFVIRAAVTFDPDDAQGLDGSLRKVADSTIGSWLVVAVAVGLMVYGTYCMLSAPRQRLVPADD